MNRPHAARVLLAGLAALTAAASLPAAQAPVSPPPTCIRNVSLGRAGGELVTLLLRDGRIEAVLDAAAAVPPGSNVVEGEGLIALPAFLDAFTTHGCATPEPVKDRDTGFDAAANVQVDMRLANRKGVQPSFQVADALAVTKEQGEAWRAAGFGAALVAPDGQLLAGTSTLATTREAAMRDVIVRPTVFAHATFSATGPGYPSTLMAHFAQLRQFFYDVEWQSERQLRHEQGRSGIRPPFDADLAAGVSLITQEARLVCAAESHRDIERWVRLADEFGLDIAISGGRDAWRVADLLAEREIPVFLTLDWAKEVKDPRPQADEEEGEEEEEEAPVAEGEPETPDVEENWEYMEPLAVRIDKRLRWEETRDGAIRLHEAGVRFAFGTGDGKPEKILGRIRDLIEAGLPAEVAEAALTTEAAKMLGADARCGRIAPGYDATLVLWNADPLTETKAKPVWTFVDGFGTAYEYEAEGEIDEEELGDPEDVNGTWVTEGDEMGSSTFVLVMAKDGSLTGKLHSERPDGEKAVSDLTGRVRGDRVELEATIRADDFEIEVTCSMTVDGNVMDGEMSFKLPFSEEPMVRDVTATRDPDGWSPPYSCHEIHWR